MDTLSLDSSSRDILSDDRPAWAGIVTNSASTTMVAIGSKETRDNFDICVFSPAGCPAVAGYAAVKRQNVIIVTSTEKSRGSIWRARI
jgi:hypothetical protein